MGGGLVGCCGGGGGGGGGFGVMSDSTSYYPHSRVS